MFSSILFFKNKSLLYSKAFENSGDFKWYWDLQHFYVFISSNISYNLYIYIYKDSSAKYYQNNRERQKDYKTACGRY